LDITDAGAVNNLVAQFQPSHFINLAGLSTLAEAEVDYQAAWKLHVFAALNIANAILSCAPGCSLLAVGSGEVYGASARSCALLDESIVLSPSSQYAATKAAADLALGSMVHKGLRVIRLRPFNHTGPGQSTRFVVGNFAKQIAEIEAGLISAVIRVGNLDMERDFLDVRDVVSAYVSAVQFSDSLPAGTIINVASGIPIAIRCLLEKLLAQSTHNIRVETDAIRIRQNEVQRYVGDATLARRLLDWSPKFRIDETLRHTLEHFRANL
jgi:GDP-4-dehydro-6-deoxy-D-mannose reductase